jgi:hypothetical protein
MTGSKRKKKGPRSNDRRSNGRRSKAGSNGRRSKGSRKAISKGSRSKGEAQSTCPIDIISGVFAGLLKVANKEDLGVILKLILKLLDKKLASTDCSVITKVNNYFKHGRGKGIVQSIITSNPGIEQWLKTSSNFHLLVSKLDKCSTGSGSQVKIGGAQQLPSVGSILWEAAWDNADNPLLQLMVTAVFLMAFIVGSATLDARRGCNCEHPNCPLKR